MLESKRWSENRCDDYTSQSYDKPSTYKLPTYYFCLVFLYLRIPTG